MPAGKMCVVKVAVPLAFGPKQIWLENSLNKMECVWGYCQLSIGVVKKIKVAKNKGNTGKIPPDLRLNEPYKCKRCIGGRRNWLCLYITFHG